MSMFLGQGPDESTDQYIRRLEASVINLRSVLEANQERIQQLEAVIRDRNRG